MPRSCRILSVSLAAILGVALETYGQDGQVVRIWPVEANPSGVDLVPLRLFRMEARRWQHEAKLHGGMLGPPRHPAPEAEDAASIEAEPIIPVDDTFEDWAFGGKDRVVKFRQELTRLLDRKVREVEQLFILTDLQRGKLRLAGKGDLQRLLDSIEDAHHEFDRSRTDAARLVELQKHLRLVELRIAEGPFETGSLFAKTLRKLFDEKQLRRRSSPSNS